MRICVAFLPDASSLSFSHNKSKGRLKKRILLISGNASAGKVVLRAHRCVIMVELSPGPPVRAGLYWHWWWCIFRSNSSVGAAIFLFIKKQIYAVHSPTSFPTKLILVWESAPTPRAQKVKAQSVHLWSFFFLYKFPWSSKMTWNSTRI